MSHTHTHHDITSVITVLIRECVNSLYSNSEFVNVCEFVSTVLIRDKGMNAVHEMCVQILLA